MKLGSFKALGAVLACAVSVFATGCSEETAAPQPRPLGDGGLVRPKYDAGVSSGRCITGTTRDCSIVIGVHNGVISCFYGTQVCVDELWGPCGDGTTEDLEGVPGVVGAGVVALDGGAPPQ